jgi:hypothetical protein
MVNIAQQPLQRSSSNVSHVSSSLRSSHNQPDILWQRVYNVAVQFVLPEESPLRFRFPTVLLRVSDADQDGIFVATDTFSRVYGEGTEVHLAIGDYLNSLLARFQDLEAHEETLAPGLRKDLANLRRYLVRTE